MSEPTILASGERVVVGVEQLEQELWQATATYRGVPYASKAETAAKAKAALIFVLESEANT